MSGRILTAEEVRMHRAERFPGEVRRLADALGITPEGLQARLDRGDLRACPHEEERGCVLPEGHRGACEPRFTFRVGLTEAVVAGLLCCAWEGGSNYWAEADGTPYTHGMQLRLPVTVWEKDDEPCPLCSGKGYRGSRPTTCEGCDGGGFRRTKHVLDLAAIQRGLDLLPTLPHHLEDVVGDNMDASTGDVFLQLCLLGKLVYG